MQPRLLTWLGVVGTCAALLGCAAGDAPPERAGSPTGDQSPSAVAPHDHGHDHPSTGPRGGRLIELGEHEFAAELTRDDASHATTVHLSQWGGAETAFADHDEIRLQLLQDGRFVEYVLKADASANGRSAFTVVDERLAEALEAPKVRGRLHVTIGGKAYIGALEWSADDHEDHGHDDP